MYEETRMRGNEERKKIKELIQQIKNLKKRKKYHENKKNKTTKVSRQNNNETKNIKTIYRDVRYELGKLLEALIKALNEKHNEAAVINFKYGGFENEAKKLKKELSKGAHNVKDEYTFIGNMTQII